MSTTAKTAALVVGGGSIAVSGAYAGGVFDESRGEVQLTPWVSIAEEIKDKSNPYSSKLGDTYKNYLFGVHGGPTNPNALWWKASFERYTSDKKTRTFSSLFTGLKKAYEPISQQEIPATNKSLNVACKEVYKKASTEISKTKTDPIADNYRLWDDLWTYCSELGHVPLMIQDAEGEDSNYSENNAVGSTDKDKLLSVKDSQNDLLWTWKQTEFMAGNPEGDYFKAVKKTTNPSPLLLKEKCRDIYSKTPHNTGTADSPKKDHILKYCTLDETTSSP